MEVNTMALFLQRLIVHTRPSILRLPSLHFHHGTLSSLDKPPIPQLPVKQISRSDKIVPSFTGTSRHLERRCRFCIDVFHHHHFCYSTSKISSHQNQTTPMRTIHYSASLGAGHNKWSKVKHIKGPKDLEKSKVFTKIGIQIKMAVRDGGSNPESNSTLASVVSFAKTKAMPKTTIDAMIQKAATSKQGDSQATFEVRGPGNASFLVSVLTDKTKRAKQEITHIVNKNGGALGEPGSAMFAFQRKGVIRVPCEVEGQDPMTFDTAEELAIDVGAEEVLESTEDDGQNIYMFVCDPSDLRGVRDGLVTRSLQFQSCTLEFVPQTTVALSESDLEKAVHLINVLEEHEDVVKVFDNVAWGD